MRAPFKAVPVGTNGCELASIVAADAIIGKDTRVWHFAYVGPGAKIGERCIIGQGVHIGPNVIVGDGCKIQNGAQLFEGVTLEDDVFIGPHVVFTNVLHPRAFVSRRANFVSTTVEHGASIGANATILCGNTVGKYALVGAGTVVTSGLRPHEIVAGVPARHFGWVCRCGMPLRVEAPLIAVWHCPACKSSYVMGASGTLVLQE